MHLPSHFNEVRPASQFKSPPNTSQRHTPTRGSHESLTNQIDPVRALLDQDLSSEAEKQSRALIKAVRLEPATLAKAHCILSVALEMQGRYLESLDAVKTYELPESHKGLSSVNKPGEQTS